VQGDIIVARMSTTNAVGTSAYSDSTEISGVTYADVRTFPHQPASPPTRGSGTTLTQIEVVVAALTGTATGGSPILSYHIEYDGASAGATWTELQGYSSNSLSLSVIQAGLTPGTIYQVRYRARTIFGWSVAYSDASTIATIIEPS
jgi:hypothetical protein